jgi:hypothetical protein
LPIPLNRSEYMQRAALCACASGDLQAKEGTIESQVLALKKRIAAARHTLGMGRNRCLLQAENKVLLSSVEGISLCPHASSQRHGAPSCGAQNGCPWGSWLTIAGFGPSAMTGISRVQGAGGSLSGLGDCRRV